VRKSLYFDSLRKKKFGIGGKLSQFFLVLFMIFIPNHIFEATFGKNVLGWKLLLFLYQHEDNSDNPLFFFHMSKCMLMLIMVPSLFTIANIVLRI